MCDMRVGSEEAAERLVDGHRPFHGCRYCRRLEVKDNNDEKKQKISGDRKGSR